MISDQTHLFEEYIEQNPDRPGPANARLIGYGVPIWALVGYLRAVHGDARRVAIDYDLTHQAMQAALRYYEQHKDVIDARIEANQVSDNSGTPVVFDAA